MVLLDLDFGWLQGLFGLVLPCFAVSRLLKGNSSVPFYISCYGISSVIYFVQHKAPCGFAPASFVCVTKSLVSFLEVYSKVTVLKIKASHILVPPLIYRVRVDSMLAVGCWSLVIRFSLRGAA